ncbi:MAG: NAD/NADP-dependent betaine aldehyde dehydrogenase [Phycisphaerae bacterium]|nr:NAD/NADP-dependent betaine aldehyde dehydrogenase [Phycisphaerae bacterium]
MKDLFEKLGLSANSDNPGGFCGEWLAGGKPLDVVTPIDGSRIATVRQITTDEYARIAERAHQAFLKWRVEPAPRRGEIVRQLGDALRRVKKELGALVTLEMGKIAAEGEGEVQEMIDICDFACGLSRQLYGLSMHSERPRHRMYEQWHPLGVVGIISAFNFPVAVWSWNAAIAAVCGDACLWKPASKTPLTAIACTKLAERVCRENGVDPAIFSLTIGPGSSVGEAMLHDKCVPLVSATGSCAVGARVAEIVGKRFGRTILELGGNNAIIVTPSANLDLALRAILFGAVGTAGQRCTSTRRIIVHAAVKEELVARLRRAYETVRIGDPRKPDTLMGPLVTLDAVRDMQNAVRRVKEEGGKVVYGGEPLSGPEYPGGHYVRPCIAEARNEFKIVQEETFAPILYVIEYGGGTKPRSHEAAKGTEARTKGSAGVSPASAMGQRSGEAPKGSAGVSPAVAAEQASRAAHLQDLAEAIALHNAVPQGLSSAIFSTNVLESETFLSHVGSDCGIANVNIGTSGAEIGGAFGGEKETGGGRESGSDSWKVYMRRQTNTINWSTELPLAQGIKFAE